MIIYPRRIDSGKNFMPHLSCKTRSGGKYLSEVPPAPVNDVRLRQETKASKGAVLPRAPLHRPGFGRNTRARRCNKPGRWTTLPSLSVLADDTVRKVARTRSNRKLKEQLPATSAPQEITIQARGHHTEAYLDPYTPNQSAN